MKVKLSAPIFCATLKFAGKNDVRYYLNGVYVEPSAKGGVTLVATNGHVMAILHDPHGTTDGVYIIPHVAVKPKHETLEFDGLFCKSPDGDALKCKFIEGRYPDYRAVVPDEFPAGAPAYYNIGYLALTEEEALALIRERADGNMPACDGCLQAEVRRFHYSRKWPDVSSVVNFGAKVPAIVIIMPLRYDELKAYPDFFTQPSVMEPEHEPAKPKRARKVKS